ncbi:MAG: DNA topoisomerase I, partial [Alphaproteobacteria bacterium]|nr:DNA topoisomerase I [Alphaproteobacteria bacterium]
FIGCTNYPAWQYTRRHTVENGHDAADTLKKGMRVLGAHPESGEEISVRRGPYGLYVQEGGADKEAKRKPRRASLPRGMDGETITLDQAVSLLSLPRIVGIHPETREPIEAGIGRFGPYVKMGAVFASLDRDDDVLVVGLNRAVDVLAQKLANMRTLGPHPGDKEPVLLRKGRFGLYVQHGNMVANVPRDAGIDDVTLAQAVELLAGRGKPLKARGGRKAKAAVKPRPAPQKAAAAAAKPKAKAKPAAKKPKAKPKRAAKPAAPPRRKAVG